MAQSDTYGGVAQVGGSHYGTKYGHWDYCKDAETPYLEGHATKYLVRWEKKGGIQDLEKSLSFVEKIMVGNENTNCDRGANQYEDLLNRMLDENDVGDFERTAITSILHWQSYEDLQLVHESLKQFIKWKKEAAEHQAEASSAYTNQGK